MKPSKVILRMCAVCKEMKDKSQLIRTVKNKEGEIFIDSTGKAAGRGAFVCRSAGCIERCKKQRSLNKSFKCNVPDEIYEQLLLSIGGN